jgi:hypothetical protein
VARMTTVKRFEEWSALPENIEFFFSVIEGSAEQGKMAFRDACFDPRVKVPFTLMHAFVHSRPELKARYEAILAAKAEELVHEALDDVAEAVDVPSAAVARVKSDVKLKVASKWDRYRYGDAKDAGGSGGITVVVDRSCGGQVSIESGEHRVVVGGVSQEKIVSGAEASTLPAEIPQEA